MHEPENTTAAKSPEPDELMRRILARVDERFDVEAIAHLVENMASGKKADLQLQHSIRDLWRAMNRQGMSLGAVHSELRDLLMDMALVKRALSSLGQVGVMERQRIEKELILDLFPPRLVRTGTGVMVAHIKETERKIDCEERLPICKAACCRIFNVHLTAEEVERNRYDWNPRSPYTLHKNRLGCVHLRPSNWSCSLYDCRPAVCSAFSCQSNPRIWADFDKKVVNPDLKAELDKLDGGPSVSGPDKATDGQAALPQEQSSVNPPDFSELRRRIEPEPRRKFVPPESTNSGAISTASVDRNGEAECELP